MKVWDVKIHGFDGEYWTFLFSRKPSIADIKSVIDDELSWYFTGGWSEDDNWDASEVEIIENN